MATVGTTVFVEDGSKNFFTLNNNEQYLRKFAIQNSWTYMTAGILFNIEGTGTNLTGGLWLGFGSSANGNFGMKSYTSCSILVGSGNGWIGNIIGYGSSYGPFTYNLDAPSGSYFYNTGEFTTAISGGAIQQQAGNVVANYQFPAEGPFLRKGIHITAVNRASATSIAYQGAYNNVISSSLGSNHNHTINSLHSAIQNTFNSIVIDGRSTTTFGTVALSGWNSTTHPLDTINIYWTGSKAIRIYGVAVAVLN